MYLNNFIKPSFTAYYTKDIFDIIFKHQNISYFANKTNKFKWLMLSAHGNALSLNNKITLINPPGPPS